MSIGIIIQARLGSTRLPQKVLLPFNGSTILKNVVDRVSQTKLPFIVATTNSAVDDPLVSYMQSNGIPYFRGAECHVLQRFIGAAGYFGFDSIVRVCADNPFLDVLYLRKLIDIWQEHTNLDYLSFSFNAQPIIKTHFGFFAEIVRASALQILNKEFPENELYQEHVTVGIYSNASKFNVELCSLDKELVSYRDIRLTIDTAEDYKTALSIIREFPYKETTGFQSLAEWIVSQEEIIDSMRRSIEANKK